MPTICVNGTVIDTSIFGDSINLDALAKRKETMKSIFTPKSKATLTEEVANADSSKAKVIDCDAPTKFKWIGDTPVPKPIPKSKDTNVRGLGKCKQLANTSTERLVVDSEGNSHIIEKQERSKKPRLLRKNRDGLVTNTVLLQDGNTIEVLASNQNQDGVSRIFNN